MTAYVPLYQSVGLERKSHRLRIQTGTPANAAARLYIDFFTVITGSDSASGNIIVDDRDPSIQYTGSWGDAGVRWEYEQTTKQAPSDQAGGTARFLFNGAHFIPFFVLSMSPSCLPTVHRNQHHRLWHVTIQFWSWFDSVHWFRNRRCGYGFLYWRTKLSCHRTCSLFSCREPLRCPRTYHSHD